MLPGNKALGEAIMRISQPLVAGVSKTLPLGSDNNISSEFNCSAVSPVFHNAWSEQLAQFHVSLKTVVSRRKFTDAGTFHRTTDAR